MIVSKRATDYDGKAASTMNRAKNARRNTTRHPEVLSASDMLESSLPSSLGSIKAKPNA